MRITTAAVQIHNMQPKFNSLFDQNLLEMNAHTAFRFILTTLRVTMFYTTYMFIYINKNCNSRRAKIIFITIGSLYYVSGR